MVTEKEWSSRIQELKDAIDNWDFKMKLMNDELSFLDDTISEAIDELNSASWRNLQEYLKEVENSRKKDDSK